VLLVLDNTETLARSSSEEDELAKVIGYMGRRLCRVLVTSRRRERIEALPLQIPPMDEQTGVRLLRRLADEYGANALRQAGEPAVRKIVRTLGGRPLLLDVLARLVGKFAYSLDRGVDNVLRLAAGDLGTFLYEDAWARIGGAERSALLVLGQFGDAVNSQVVGWTAAEESISHLQLLAALEETHFGRLMEYGASYDLALDASARAFLAQKLAGLGSAERTTIERAASRVRKKHVDWLSAHAGKVSDRVEKAFRSDAAKAAHRAASAGQTGDALRWYEEAIQADRGNAALLDRFAWFLMKEMRDYVRAAKVAKEACVADPADGDAHFTAGMIAARLGDVAQADRLLASAQNLGKGAHLCALQRVRARCHALELVFAEKNVDLARAKELDVSARSLLHAARLDEPASPLDAKHMVEVVEAERRLDRLRDRLSGIEEGRIYGVSRRS
jgi:Tfp pilus assembly protein PilF